MVLITGANGQLGQCFQQLAVEFPALQCHFAGAEILDIADKRAVKRFFSANKINWVINCAAYTAVDKAENEPAQAKRINVTGVRNLAEASASIGAFLVHFSSDYVYHSPQNTAYCETDRVQPKGVYARTKLLGERAALRAHPNGTMVIRTSWVYSPFGQNFAKTMLRLGKSRPVLQVVADQIGSPTYAPDLARVVLQLIDQARQQNLEPAAMAGIWNYSNEGVASWYDFAEAIFEITGINCQVVPIETKDYPTPAQRPPFSVMNKNKFKTAFQVEIPHWRYSLKKCLGEIPA